MRQLLLLLAVFLPQPLKMFFYRRVFGWKIGKRVRIGFSYIESREVTISEGVTVGHLNVIRGVRCLIIGNGTFIANFNEIFGGVGGELTPKEIIGGESTLIIGENSQIMSHHFFDVPGRIMIGSRVVVGGRGTQFWGHTRNYMDGAPSLEAVNIAVGDDVYIGARATLLACSIPNGAIVGAGSVVNKSFAPEDCRLLIAGNPAAIKKRYEQ